MRKFVRPLFWEKCAILAQWHAGTVPRGLGSLMFSSEYHELEPCRSRYISKRMKLYCTSADLISFGRYGHIAAQWRAG